MATPEISASVPVTVLSVGFVPVENMSVPRSRHTATLLADGRVLVAGGTSDSAHSAQLFIPSSISFTATSGGMVHVRSGQCAALLQDGRVLIVGGDDGHGNLTTTAEVFDPATQTFFSTGNLNHARTAATCTLLPNGKVLIAGGQDSAGTLLPSAELYDAFAGTFTLTGSMQHARAQHTATLLSNGRVLLVGNSYDSTSAEVFDPAAGVFRATGSLSQPRAHETATLLPNGKVLVLGGSQVMVPVGGGAPAAPVSIGSAELYDPASGSFHLAGKLSMARDSHSATLLANGSVLVAGGYVHTFDGDAQPEWYSVFTAELINPVTLAAKPAASLESDRTEHVATLLKNGELLVTGGRSGYQELCCSPKPYIGPLNSAELYK
jgi:WD40 repeat protein